MRKVRCLVQTNIISKLATQHRCNLRLLAHVIPISLTALSGSFLVAVSLSLGKTNCMGRPQAGPTIFSQVKLPHSEKKHILAIHAFFVVEGGAGGVLAAAGWMVIMGPREDLVHFLFASQCIRDV